MSPLCDNDEIARRYKKIVCDENHENVVRFEDSAQERELSGGRHSSGPATGLAAGAAMGYPRS
jgi:hypothetical protein